VVATAVGGVPELVEDGVTGVLVPAGDSAALVRALSDLAGNPARRRAFGKAAGRRARQFDASAMVERYAELFERVCAGGRKCRAS